MQALLLPTLSAVMVKVPTLAHPVGGPGEELRIARSDESLTPFSLSQLLEQHPPESAQKIWRDAVPHKDAAGNIQHVLVKIGQQSRWGLVDRISQESVLLAGMLSCDEDSTVLDLRAIVGYDLSDDICQRILTISVVVNPFGGRTSLPWELLTWLTNSAWSGFCLR